MPFPFIVVPTYHELENLPKFTERLWDAVPNAKLLLVDDASGDGTPDWVKAHPRYNRSLFLLERTGKLGLGTAYLAGFAWVVQRHKEDPCNAVVQMDADLSHDPNAVPDFLRAVAGGSDLVLASRYCGGLRVINWPLSRLMLSKSAAKYVQVITGMPFTDPTGGYKCFRRKVLETIELDAVDAQGYQFQVEMTYRTLLLGFTVQEVPITFADRVAGGSKMSRSIVLEAMRRVPLLRLEAMRGRLPRK